MKVIQNTINPANNSLFSLIHSINAFLFFIRDVIISLYIVFLVNKKVVHYSIKTLEFSVINFLLIYIFNRFNNYYKKSRQIRNCSANRNERSENFNIR